MANRSSWLRMFISAISLLIFCALVLSIIERGVLKFLHIVDLSIFHYSYVSFTSYIIKFSY